MQHPRRGMTFFEVTVVVLIIGMLAAIGAPRYARSARIRSARNAAIQLAAYVDYVRITAINEGRSASLSIDASSDLFSSSNVDFPDRTGVPISVSLKEQFDLSLELTASFDTATTITFDLEGMPTVNSAPLLDGVISVTSQDLGYEIRISAGSGTATITEITVTPENNEIAE